MAAGLRVKGADTMSGWPEQPVIYEVNTAVWLGGLSRSAGRRLTLADVGAADWDAVTPAGVDAVWLMGVWERSPAGLALAKANADLQASFRAALPDLRDEDIIGSPYCVREYVVDAAFGGPEALAAARGELAARGTRLLLDYVPNHVAPDHPWVTGEPQLFIQGDETMTSRRIKRAGCGSEGTCWRSDATRTFRHGPTSCSLTRFPRLCAPRRHGRWPASLTSATESGATWPC